MQLAVALHAQLATNSLLLHRSLLCRLAAASPADADARGHLARSGGPMSVQSEAAALCCLQAACSAALAQLPSSLRQDEELLVQLTARAQSSGTAVAQGVEAAGQAAAAQAQQEHECLAAAVEWRACYKRTLQRCEQACRRALDVLAGGEAAAACNRPRCWLGYARTCRLLTPDACAPSTKKGSQLAVQETN